MGQMNTIRKRKNRMKMTKSIMKTTSTAKMTKSIMKTTSITKTTMRKIMTRTMNTRMIVIPMQPPTADALTE